MEIVLAVVVGLLVFRDWYRDNSVEREREAWAKERAELLQRIQAPQVAVMSHAAVEPVEDIGLPLVGDDEYSELFDHSA